MTEDELQAKVTAMCDERGLMWHHCRDSRRCHGRRGLPDLLLAGEHGVLFRELKGEHGVTSSMQDLWGWILRKAGQDWALWRPSDLESGLIAAEMEKIS